MMEACLFAISITVPNLFLLAFGFFLRSKKQIGEAFIAESSVLVFNYFLPSLLFFSILDSKADITQQVSLISAGLITTLMLFTLAEIYAYFFVKENKDKGVFVQGVFRSNMAIIALSTVYNAYGSYGLGIASLYMGVVTILFNTLAVITLSRTQSENEQGSIITKIRVLTQKIVTNPLIIALVLGFVYKSLNIPSPPAVVLTIGDLLANTALPLAMICAGASLDVKSMLQPSGVSMQASIGRIIIAPITAIVVGVMFDLHATNPVFMGVLFIMVASPAASASYIMAKAMGGNEVLAANILAFTTVFSMIGMGVGAALLRLIGWI